MLKRLTTTGVDKIDAVHKPGKRSILLCILLFLPSVSLKIKKDLKIFIRTDVIKMAIILVLKIGVPNPLSTNLIHFMYWEIMIVR